jgi:mannitol-1-phosphate 5-dehydrogenase
MGKIVIFGAGKVGRSFIGQIFSSAGFEVVFVDVADALVKTLNRAGRYRVEVRDVHPKTLWVDNVRAVHGNDVARVTAEVATADLVATVVGANNLKYLYGNIARGLQKRQQSGKGALNIIICENLRNSSRVFRPGLAAQLPADFPLDSLVGLVETSTDKMVPDVPEHVKLRDPLVVYAEAFNTLIVDRSAFIGDPPRLEHVEAKGNIHAYFDRKFFSLNTGHAITAYLGHLSGRTYIWDAIRDANLQKFVEGAMWESGQSLVAEYPEEFNASDQRRYISDLIRRFHNKALNDTIHRVGRDLPRKLARNDRLIGALLLDAKHGIPAPYTVIGTAAAMMFRSVDEHGELYPRDRFFADELYSKGVNHVLSTACGLDPNHPDERRLGDEIGNALHQLQKIPWQEFRDMQLEVMNRAIS